jgi:[citrate (pro-3S)-lyase] ligase
MRRVLPPCGVEPVEIPRREWRGAAVSASRVRAALRTGELAAALDLVPETTAAFLRTDEGRAIQERLRRGARET